MNKMDKNEYDKKIFDDITGEEIVPIRVKSVEQFLKDNNAHPLSDLIEMISKYV